jgi:hypothetical protein
VKGAVTLLRSIVQSDDRRNVFKQEWRCTVASLFPVFDLGRNVAEPLGKGTRLLCVQGDAAPWIAIRPCADGVLRQNQ